MSFAEDLKALSIRRMVCRTFIGDLHGGSPGLGCFLASFGFSCLTPSVLKSEVVQMLGSKGSRNFQKRLCGALNGFACMFCLRITCGPLTNMGSLD